MRQKRFFNNLKQRTVQRALENKEFGRHIKEYKSRFANFGHPIPPRGFSNQAAFRIWKDGVWKTYNQILRSKKYKDAINTLTGGQDKFSYEIWEKVEELKINALPHIYEHHFKQILERFGLNPENRDDRDWLELVIFFGKKDYPHLITTVKLTRDKSGELQEWVRILPYTRPTDIPLKLVTDMQKHLLDYVGKNKQRDRRIVARNKEVVDMTFKLKQKLTYSSRERSPKGESLASKTASKLKKKYPELNENLVKTILVNESR